MKFFILSLLAALTAGAPTPNKDAHFESGKTLETVGEDAENLALSVAEGVGFASGVAVNAAVAGADAALIAVAGVKDTAVAAGEQAAEYIENFDAMEALDNTEESLKTNKDALLTTIFDAKRTGVEVLRDAGEATGHAIGVVVDHKVNGFHKAVEAASNGYEVSKEAVSHATKDITIENAEAALTNAHRAVTVGVHTAKDAIEGAVTTLVDTIATAKVAVIEGAQNFDSKTTITNAKQGISHAIHETAKETGSFFERVGIFDAIDNLVHKLGAMKGQVTEFFASKTTVDDETPEGDKIDQELVKIKRHIVQEEKEDDVISQLWDMVKQRHQVHKRCALCPEDYGNEDPPEEQLRQGHRFTRTKYISKAKKAKKFFKKY